MDNTDIKHPGEILLEEIEKIGMSQKELAIRTGMSEKHISTVINGSKDISPTFAKKLEYALGSNKSYWTVLQNEYDRKRVEIEEKNEITKEEVGLLKPLKDIVDYYVKSNIIKNNCSDFNKILQLRTLLRVSNLTAIPKIPYNGAYRAQISKNTSVDPYILFAWQRLCEVKTENIKVNKKYDTEKLIENIDLLKEIMFETCITTIVTRLKNVLAECGIAFEVVKHFRGAPVQGFIKKTDRNKVILCLTARGKKADKFWFSFFHEIGHLINGDIDLKFVDFDSVATESEQKADEFARNTLINPETYKKFISSREFSKLSDIKSFSKKINVPYWITLGRLHKDEWLDWSYLGNQTPNYEFDEML